MFAYTKKAELELQWMTLFRCIVMRFFVCAYVGKKQCAEKLNFLLVSVQVLHEILFHVWSF